MPLAAIAHLLVALYFGVHAIRTGRNMYWLMVLFMFPLLGSVVYFFAEYLPDMRNGRVARKAVSTVVGLVDPKRELREARADFERTPSVEHRARLAQALLGLGEAAEAVDHYQQCVTGPYAKDGKFRLGLARAQIAAGQAAAAVQTLDSWFADDAQAQSGEPSLLYARALADVDPQRAARAFELAMERYATTETRADYGLFLARQGRAGEARQQLEQVLRDAKLGTSHSRDMNRGAIDRARAALDAMDRQA